MNWRKDAPFFLLSFFFLFFLSGLWMGHFSGAAVMSKQKLVKADYIELIASLVVFYTVQRAVLTDLPVQPEATRQSFQRTWKRIQIRAIAAGVSPRCFFAMDCRAHAIAYSWYSATFEDYVVNKHST